MANYTVRNVEAKRVGLMNVSWRNDAVALNDCIDVATHKASAGGQGELTIFNEGGVELYTISYTPEDILVHSTETKDPNENGYIQALWKHGDKWITSYGYKPVQAYYYDFILTKCIPYRGELLTYTDILIARERMKTEAQNKIAC